ncbi:MAG: ABC transporter permease, partial [Gammaproteobacteria bacterium]
MSHIPLSYALRSVLARKLTTVLTASGMALVVFVFAAVLMLAQGLKDTLVQTGSPDNVMVIRRGAETEVQSEVQRDQAAVIASLPQVAHGTSGRRLVSKEIVVLMVLPKRGGLKPSNVIIRGLSVEGLALRPQVRLSHGRLFRPGAAEVIAGQKVAQGFLGAGTGEVLRLGLRDWTVVGTFDAGNTGFSSEIWGDAEQLMQAFRRQSFSSLIFRLAEPSALPAIKARIKDDPRLTVEAKPETQFYLEQSEVMANFLNILGLTLSVIFSIGAVIGAMITMYAAVASTSRCPSPTCQRPR